MTKRIADFLVKIFGGFSVISLLAQFFEYQARYARPVIASSTIVFGVVAAISMLRSRSYDNAMKALANIADNIAIPRGPVVKFVDNVAELRELWALDAECYGPANVSFECLRSWWEGYACGIYILKEEGNIIGAFGLWPLNKSTFEALLDGRKRETELAPLDFQSHPGVAGYHNWYISGIVLKKRFRRTQRVLYLLGHAMSLWLQETSTARNIRICALGYTREGESLLRRFGFSRYREGDETLDGWPTYLHETRDISWVRNLAKRISHAGQLPKTV